MTTTLLPKGFSNLHYKPRLCTTFSFGPRLGVAFSKLSPNRSSEHGFSNSFRNIVRRDTTKWNFVVYSAVQPEQQEPAKQNWDAWKGWAVAIFFSIVLPLSKSKWGPLLKVLNEVGETVQVAEDVVEMVEKVAKKVDDAAEDVIDDHSNNAVLRGMMTVIEKLAETTAKTAGSVDDVIDKVQELEEELEEYLAENEKAEREAKKKKAEEEAKKKKAEAAKKKKAEEAKKKNAKKK